MQRQGNPTLSSNTKEFIFDAPCAQDSIAERSAAMKTPALLGQMTMTLNHSGNIDSPPLATRLGGCWLGRGRLTWGGAGGVSKVTFPFVFLLFVVIIFVNIFM